MGALSADAWQATGVIVSAVAAAGSGVAIAIVTSTNRKVVRTGEKVDDASQLAEEARDYAKPTGNGFANAVQSSLARVEAGQEALTRDVASLKDKVTDQAVAHARLEGKFDGHVSASALPAPRVEQAPPPSPPRPADGR
jgi:hypothetical protein